MDLLFASVVLRGMLVTQEKKKKLTDGVYL